MHISFAALSVSLLVSLVRGHCAITGVQGANGVTAAGFGVTGNLAKPSTRVTSVIRDSEIASGKASACGRTGANGVNDIAASLEAATTAGLPSVAANGEVQMTLHQFNADGAGPFTCDVNTDGTGDNFQSMQVTTDVPGQNGRSRAKNQDFPLVALMPTGTSCTGGPDGNACIVRCRNPAGPFGGCVAVTLGAGAAAGNSTQAAGKSAKSAAKVKAAKGDERKRVVRSRVLQRRLAGLWI